MQATDFFAWDISSILFFILLFFFVVTLLDRLLFAKKRAHYFPLPRRLHLAGLALLRFVAFLTVTKKEKANQKPVLVRWALSYYPVILLIFILRSFVFEPFQIPSNSMMPNLLTGDFILVNKFAYGLRLPVNNKKILSVSQPERGDILVFRYPNYERDAYLQGKDFIKRLVALPGDEISYLNDKLWINGKRVDSKEMVDYQGIKSGLMMTGYKQSQEHLDNHRYDILLHPNVHSRSVQKLIVPKGMYFVLGDNRANSADSRFWGFVPEDFIIGKAFFIWFHWDFTFFDWFFNFDFSWLDDFSWQQTFKTERWGNVLP